MSGSLKLVAGKEPNPPNPILFSGFGVFLTSEVHSVHCPSGQLPAQQLIESLGKIVGYQTAIIEAHGGKVEQFVGDCVLAYWPPSERETMMTSACAAVTEIIQKKAAVVGLDYCLRLNFAAAELAGAVFGPPTAFRFQVVGKARDRANTLPRSASNKDSVFTDAETLSILPPEWRERFVAMSATTFSLKLGRSVTG